MQLYFTYKTEKNNFRRRHSCNITHGPCLIWSPSYSTHSACLAEQCIFTLLMSFSTLVPTGIRKRLFRFAFCLSTQPVLCLYFDLEDISQPGPLYSSPHSCLVMPLALSMNYNEKLSGTEFPDGEVVLGIVSTAAYLMFSLSSPLRNHAV